MKVSNQYALFIFSLLCLVGCGKETDQLITIETKHGKMVVILFDETPKHKENFIKLAEAGRFDSTEFHRVIENFMIQGGDVFGKEGLSEEPYTLPAEFHPELIHQKGVLAAARKGDRENPEKRSSGCQFYIVQGRVYDETELVTDIKRLQESFMKFITLESNQALKQQYTELYEFGDNTGLNRLMLSKKKELENFYNLNLDKKLRPQQIMTYTTEGGTPHLDDGYTVFGKVLEGIEVMEKIAKSETDAQDKPKDPVFMKVKVEQMEKGRISKKYGYAYPEK
ncbi:peptidylprolyl isomerase [Pararhodonellum marinum]|uniref:peptidylprolyl isomerase n=1 Tax=Pararhodonellum marinum TaxID=2755358 RepID=UPI00188FFC6E|nr:peptidylprolyl isomerase [Pararhodonellum marinum]